MYVKIGAPEKKVERCNDSTARRILREAGYLPYPGTFDDDLPTDGGGVTFAFLFSRVCLCKCKVHRAARPEKLPAELTKRVLI